MASRAVPVPGPVAEQGVRAAMADQGTPWAIAGSPPENFLGEVHNLEGALWCCGSLGCSGGADSRGCYGVAGWNQQGHWRELARSRHWRALARRRTQEDAGEEPALESTGEEPALEGTGEERTQEDAGEEPAWRALARSGHQGALARSGLWGWAPTHPLICHQQAQGHMSLCSWACGGWRAYVCH